jgi:hypothetical protein
MSQQEVLFLFHRLLPRPRKSRQPKTLPLTAGVPDVVPDRPHREFIVPPSSVCFFLISIIRTTITVHHVLISIYLANTCQAQPHASVTPRQVTSNIARSTNQVKAPVITPSRIIVNTDNEMPFPPRPQQRIPVEAATRGDVGAFHDNLDSFIQPPPPLKFPLEVEVVRPSTNTHLSHPAHPRLPHVPPAAPTPNVGSTTQAKVLLESLLASARLSSVDLQLARQLFQVDLSQLCSTM